MFNITALEKKYLPIIITAFIPVLLISIPHIASIQNPDLQISVIDMHDTSNFTRTVIMIYNNGNGVAENISVSYHQFEDFELTDYIITDGFEIQTKKIEEHDAIIIDRLAPQSYVLLDVKAKSLSDDKNIWITHNQDTKNIKLSSNEEYTVVSKAINLARSSEIGIALLSTIIVFFILRHIIIRRADVLRHRHIGVLKIKYNEFYSDSFKGTIYAIIIVYTILWFYHIFTPSIPYGLLINDGLTISEFFNSYIDKTGTLGESLIFILIMGTISIGLVLTFITEQLPSYRWFQQKPRSKLYVKDVLASGIKPNKVSMKMNAFTAFKKADDVLIILDDSDSEKVIGLVAKKELKSVSASTTFTIEDLLKQKKIKFPSWSDDENARKNFTETSVDKKLEGVLNKMKDEGFRFAIIRNSKDQIIRVLDCERFEDSTLKGDTFTKVKKES